MSAIITTAEVKTILGISGSTQDTLIAFHIESAQNLLYQILGVTDLLTHSVTKEETPIYDSLYFYLDEFPVTAITTIYDTGTHDEITGYSFSIGTKNKRKVNIVDSSGVPYGIGRSSIKVTYTAGYADIDAVPNDIKTVVALMIGGLMAKNKQLGGVKEYRVGSKNVIFEDNASGKKATDIINQFMNNYSKPIVV